MTDVGECDKVIVQYQMRHWVRNNWMRLVAFVLVSIGVANLLWAKPAVTLERAEVIEWYESLLEPSTIMLDNTGWSDAEVVNMVAAAHVANMQWESQQAWRPGFETHLAIKGLTDVEIRATVLRVNGDLAVQAANAVFEALGKPSP